MANYAAKVLYDFNLDGAHANCMVLHLGEIIGVIEKREDGWWQGFTNESHGWFPGNYVEEVPLSELSPPTPTSGLDTPTSDTRSRSETQTSSETGSETPTKVSFSIDESEVKPRKSSQEGKSRRPKSRAFVVSKANSDYTPNAYDDDAIGFQKGDEIIIFEQNPTGQWKGKNVQGKIGYFPSRYVEIEDENNFDDLDDGLEDDSEDVIVQTTRPIIEEVKVKEPVQQEPNIPEGWKKTKTPDGQVYFYNPKTFERAWTIDDILFGPGEPLPEPERKLSNTPSLPGNDSDRKSSFTGLERSESIIEIKKEKKPAPVFVEEKKPEIQITTKPIIKQAPSPPVASDESIKKELELERKRIEEQAKREMEEKKRLEMMLQETQKRLEEERLKAEKLAASAEETRKAKELAEKEAQLTAERRIRELAQQNELKEKEEKLRQQQQSEEEKKKYQEQQERENLEKMKLEQKLRDLEKRLEEERNKSLQLEEEERKHREFLEEQRKQKQKELEHQQLLIRQQEAEEKRKLELEKEALRLQIEEERKTMGALLEEKKMAEAQAAQKEREERELLDKKVREMAEQLAKQQAERLLAEKESEERRLMQQKLMEAEEKLMQEKKKIEEMEKQKQILDMERQLEEEKKKMENMLFDLENSVASSIQEANKPNPNDNSIVKQRRLSTFINDLDLPAPPTNQLPPPPKKIPLAKQISLPPPPPLNNLPPPPPITAQNLPKLPPTLQNPPKQPLNPPPQLPQLPKQQLPQQPPPQQQPKPKVGFGNKLEVDQAVTKLGEKTDSWFNKFLQAGRERNLNEFIDSMKESTACIKEVLALGSQTENSPNHQGKLSVLMSSLSSSLRTLLLSAKNLANAIEQNQPTIPLLISLEKISSEVLILKYDLLDFINTNSASLFGFKDPQRDIFEDWAKKMEVHVDNMTHSIKFLANVARANIQTQYQDAAGAVITGASEMRSFLSEVVVKATDFTFKQTVNFTLMQLQEALTLLIQSSNVAARSNSQDAVQAMVNSAVKIARLTKESHTSITNKLNTL